MPDCRLFNCSGDFLCKFSVSGGETIGRSKDCDVSLLGLCDETVSREQFEIEKRKGEVFIKNVGRAKLFYNGSPIKESPMNDGMVFRFSCFFLCVGSKTGPTAYEMTWDVQTENGQRRAVLWNGINTLGSSRDNYVVIKNMDLARIHAKVSVNDKEEVFIEPVGMGRSIIINGVSLETGRQPITVDDELLLGEETYVKLIKGIRNKNAIGRMQTIVANEAAGQEIKKIAKHPLGVICALLFIILLFVLCFILFAQTIYNLLFL